jgi:hypothetical protein
MEFQVLGRIADALMPNDLKASNAALMQDIAQGNPP